MENWIEIVLAQKANFSKGHQRHWDTKITLTLANWVQPNRALKKCWQFKKKLLLDFYVFWCFTKVQVWLKMTLQKEPFGPQNLFLYAWEHAYIVVGLMKNLQIRPNFFLSWRRFLKDKLSSFLLPKTYCTFAQYPAKLNNIQFSKLMFYNRKRKSIYC